MREGESKILHVLLLNGDLSYTELKKETKLSPPSLSENLKRLILSGLIVNDIQTKKYNIRKGMNPTFIPNKDIEKKLLQNTLLSLSLYSGSLGYYAGYNSQKKKDKKILIKYIEEKINIYESLLSYSLWKIILESDNENEIKEYIEDYFIPLISYLNSFVSITRETYELYGVKLAVLERKLKEHWIDL